MKMNVKALAPLAVVAAFGLGSLAPHAQNTPQKVGYVTVEKLLQAHPLNAEITAIQKKGETELAGLQKQVQAIDAKGANASANEKSVRADLVAKIQKRAKEYDAQIQPKAAQVEKAVDAAVSSVAKANGYSMVMNGTVAAGSNLVIYADTATDLTDEALKALKK